MNHDLSFQALFHALDLAVIAIDRVGHILYVNASAVRLTGWRTTDVLGVDCSSLLSCPGCVTPCALLRERGDEHLVDLRSGKALVLGWAGSVPDSAGEPAVFLLSLRDVQAQTTEHVSRTSVTAVAAPVRDIVGRSPAIRTLLDTIRRLARTEATVLVTGESGTGKELVARAVHAVSPRGDGPFVALNCAALVDNLIESELFGHVRGAFTGAARDRAGAVEMAQGGTFFLDEIGDLNMGVQAKLLRLLQERTFQRVGETRTRAADIRVVAATNVNLERAVERGQFREDLYYRLRVIPLEIPPLRERIEDIEPLARYHLARRAVAAGRLPMRFSPSAMQVLERHPWPGNVRELVNVVDYVIALTTEQTVTPRDLPGDMREAGQRSAVRPVRGRYSSSAQDKEEEKARIEKALRDNGYHRKRTADALGMDRVTLYRKMKEMGISAGR